MQPHHSKSLYSYSCFSIAALEKIIRKCIEIPFEKHIFISNPHGPSTLVSTHTWPLSPMLGSCPSPAAPSLQGSTGLFLIPPTSKASFPAQDCLFSAHRSLPASGLPAGSPCQIIPGSQAATAEQLQCQFPP